MSRLGDKIKKALRLEAAPIGFRAAAGRRVPPLLVVLRLDSADAEAVSTAVEKGADALLFRLSEGHRVGFFTRGKREEGALAEAAESARKAVEAAGDVPCGVWQEEIDREGVAALVEAGIDFFVFSAEKTPAAALLESKAGYVLALQGEVRDSQLRAIESLPLEAIMLSEPDDALSVSGQIELRRVVGLARKPLMIAAAPPLETPELESLRDSGVSLLLLNGNEAQVLEAVPELRKRIEAVPAQPRRREERAATLPSIGRAGEEEEEEEEEEE
ncbi:MAG: hypothetical protein QME71_06235 [Dehalococcoidia bacterium]|nr:hypothetical protein [Dehalococcoidia bacterium]